MLPCGLATDMSIRDGNRTLEEISDMRNSNQGTSFGIQLSDSRSYQCFGCS
jgi:hypothetical protein